MTDWNRRPTSAFAKPGYLQPAIEPDFGTTIIRVTGDVGTAIGNGVSGTWPSVARQEYAKIQVWSADGKLIMLGDMQSGSGPTPAAQLFLDGDTYKPLFWRPKPESEVRWHPTLPDILIGVLGNGSVQYRNARTGAVTPKFTTTAYSGALMGDYEGNTSYDGRYVVVYATRVADGRKVVYAVDIDGGVKYPDVDLAANGVSSMDWASISPLGTYIQVLGVIDGRAQTSKFFTKQGALAGAWADNPLGHSDIGVDQTGAEVTFGAASSGTYSGRFLMRRLSDGAVTPLSPALSYDWHSSTRSYRRPGWGFAALNDYKGTVLDGEVYALKLDGTQSIERYGHHRDLHTDTQAAVVAVPSPDGKRVLFASNWGDPTGRPVQTYVIDTRPLCP